MPWRLFILRTCLLIFFMGVIARLFYWQVLRSDHLQAQAESQRTTTAKTLGQRGSILFSDGSTLVTSQLSYVVFADKKLATDSGAIAKTLAPILKTEEASLSAKLTSEFDWVPLDKNISSQTKKLIEELKIPGIGFDRKEIRYYPEGSMSASLLGFVGKDDAGKDKGYFGLEGYYNVELAGKAGVLREERDVFGRPILTAKAYEELPKRGHTLVTNIDRTIQYIAEKKLEEGVKKFEAKSGDVVIIDPFTGAVLAIAVYPTYDPQEYYKGTLELYKNPVVSDTYEPGSTFKSLVMAAAINEGAIKPDTVCPCGESRRIGGYTINNWDGQYRKNETVGEILKNSDNNGMIFVGEKLGREKLVSYLEQYGLGKSTNIDLQDEEVPQMRAKKDWYAIDYATATFGQGIAVTPLQLVRAVATIANGGSLVEPHIVKKIISDEKEIEIKPRIIRKVLDTNKAKDITNLLVWAVDTGEAGRLYKPKGFSIAAKSGTAQVPIAGRYDAGKVISSYVGFGPAENPRYVMLVRIREPKNGAHGATTAGPIFYDISNELFTYWGITPKD